MMYPQIVPAVVAKAFLPAVTTVFDAGLVAGCGGRGLHPNADIFTMVVVSGASDHFEDGELCPGLR